MALKWTDATTYRRGDKERVPTTWRAQAGPLRLTVTCSHIYCPGEWVGHIHPLVECVALDAESAEEAQAVIVEETRKLIEAAVSALGPVKRPKTKG